ncbi:MAG: sugar ABC transporter permease [Ruminococcaceae bacterium]|nr:sugar ABC transporter permease [Oscillospiraceae bacterium]
MQKEKKQVNKRERSERLKTSLFILPGFIGVAVFFLLPFFIVIYYSMIDNPISAEFVWFDNFIALLNNGSFKLAAKNTVLFTALALPLAIIIPLLLASILMNKIPAKSFFRTVLISPLMVPTASIILIFEVIFNYNGALNAMLAPFGIEAIDWMRGEFSRYIVILLYLWKNIGYNMILFMAAIAAIPKDMLDAASIDGATGMKTFFKIKLPYLSSTILFVGLLSLINSFKVFREVYLLTGNYPNENLYMLQHFMNNTFQRLDYQKMSSAAIIMCIVMIIIIGLLMWIDARFGKDLEAD